jgi:hypothetical protein
MLNPQRGELKISLGEKTFNGRVTLDTLMRIENGLGMGLVKIAQKLQEGDLRVNELLSIITPIVRAGGNSVDQKEVGEILWAAGLAEGMRVAGEIIAYALTAGGEPGKAGAADSESS